MSLFFEVTRNIFAGIGLFAVIMFLRVFYLAFRSAWREARQEIENKIPKEYQSNGREE